MDERSWIRQLPWRQKNKAETKSAQIKFAPMLEITREKGRQILELRLMNHSSWAVWVEEVNVILADLVADSQTAVPPERVKHGILRNVNSHETVGVTFASVIHEAAGRPQGKYSCLVLTTVRYRVFDEWCIAKLGTYRVEMEALGVFSLRSARWYDKKMKQINGQIDLVPPEHKARATLCGTKVR
jgi:hypothetical protein